MQEVIKLAVLGDIYPSGPCEAALTQPDGGQTFGRIPAFLSRFDYVVGNLESPLTTGREPISKGGPNLRADPNVIHGLKGLGLDAVGLANNHILDYGEAGLRDTIDICQQHGLGVFGAGKDISAAKKPLVVTINKCKVAFVGFAEREYSIAGQSSAGAAPLDIYASLAEIAKIRRDVDALIVLYHGGIEHYQYPSPSLQRLCRALVDAGADFVSCQHSHCIGASEVYGGRPILYGQGNFLFNFGEGRDHRWQSGLIAEITIGESVHANYVPVTSVCKGVDLSPPAQSIELMTEFERRSQNALDPQRVQSEWDAFCESREGMYIDLVLGLNRYVRFLNRATKGALVRQMYARADLMNILNIVRCESHREVLLGVLEKRVNSRVGG